MSPASNFDDTLQKLTTQVNQINSSSSSTIDNSNNVNSNSSSWSLPKINFSSSIIYYTAPVIVLIIILVLWKPNFITEEVSTDGEIPKRKISLYKLSITVALVILIALSARWLFKYCLNKKNSVVPDNNPPATETTTVT